MSDTYQLVIKQGPGSGQMYAVDKDEMIIGRGIDCDLSIIEPGLSRRHARITRKDGEYFVEDLGSTNGTRLNGEPLTEIQPLEAGAQLQLGPKVLLSFELLSEEVVEKTMAFSPEELKTAVGLEAESVTSSQAAGSKVFISYSRRNKEFVQKLHGGLRAAGMNVWVDWEGIPLTADWWQEIVDAIEGADGFVFVISPDSLASEVCGRELKTAIETNKRLIPVLHIDPEKGSQIPDQISSHNWVFMRNVDELRTNLSALIESINTDLDWVRTHTRLLVRAVEWEKSSKNKSFLLQGDDLQHAENWLQNAAKNQPPPTPLHLEYIQASRQAANRRQRTVVTASLSAVAITLVLAVVAVIFAINATQAEDRAVLAQQDAESQAVTAEAARNEAENQAATAEVAQQEAENQAATAEAAQQEAADRTVDALNAERAAEREQLYAKAGEIAANALSLADTNPPLAALLALESQRVSADNATAREALAEVPAFYPPLVDTFVYPSGSVSALAWAPSGELALALSDGETFPIILWDTEAHETALVLEGHQDSVNSIAWSDDGVLASGSADGSVIIWDLASGQPSAVFSAHNSGVSGVAWSRTGRLASSSWDGTIVLYDRALTGIETTLEYGSQVNAIAFGPFGQLASGSSDGSVSIWNVATYGIDVSYNDQQGSVSSIAFSPDGFLASGSNDGTIAVRNPFGGAPQILKGHLDYVNDVAWSADGRLASGSWDDTVIFWDLDAGRPAQVLRGHNSQIVDIDWNQDGLLASTAEFVYIWDSNKKAAISKFEGHLDWVYSVAWTADNELVSSSGDGWTYIWDMDTKTVGEAWQNFGYNNAVDVYGSFLLTGNSFYDRETGFSYYLPIDSGYFSPDGSQILSDSWQGDGTLAVWDVASFFSDTGVISETLSVDGGSFTGAAWSPDGNAVAAGLDDGTILLWDRASGNTEDLYSHEAGVSAIDWAADGRLASASSDSQIILYDVDARQIISTFSGSENENITDLAWSQGGDLATSTNSGLIDIWDLANGNPSASVRAPYKRPVYGIAWSPDGSQIAFGGESFLVFTYNTDYAQPPCEWLPRNLTEFEWTKYLSFDDTYKLTCPDLKSEFVLDDTGGSTGTGEEVTTEPAPEVVIDETSFVSLESSLPATVDFVNESDTTVDLFWVDPDGTEQYYWTLAPGENLAQETFFGHAWLVRDPNGLIVIAYYVTGDNSQTVKIDDTLVGLAQNYQFTEYTNLISWHSEADVSLVFDNQTQDTFEVYWMDYDGAFFYFGVLEAGSSFEIGTYLTHPWVLFDEEGNVVLKYIATNMPEQVVPITEAMVDAAVP